MRILVVGTGDAFSTERFGCCCVLEGNKGLVLVDCPDNICRALKEANLASGWDVDVMNMQDIVITHLHGDHCNGLEALGFLRWLGHRNLNKPLPRLHCWKPIANRLWERLAPAMDQGGKATLRDYFELHLLDPEHESLIAGIHVSCRQTDHSVPTIALKFQSGTHTLAWSSDTPFDPDLIQWLEHKADLIIHETSPPPTHTPIEPLNALPASIKSRMRLMHMPDGFSAACTDIVCLQQGEVITI